MDSSVLYYITAWLLWGRPLGLRLTVSLYLAKLNVMLTQSNFIFSRFLSREYSLLAAAPMGSSLKRERRDSHAHRGGSENTAKEEFQLSLRRSRRKPLVLLKSYSKICRLLEMFYRVSSLGTSGI